MVDSFRSALPPSYSHLFGAVFDRPKVVERRATCDRCSMCDHGEPSPVPMEYFEPSTKCCTFWPILPNYLVGAILADGSPELAEGRRRIKEAIARRIGVLPYDLTRPRKWSLLMSAYQEAFGRAKSLRCPYFDEASPDAACTIWRHREAICMTYYCRYSGGARGFELWTALKSYLGFVQSTLSRSAATAIDPRVVQPHPKKGVLTAEDMDDLPPKAADYAAWWGRWVGREEEFYLACHDWVQTLSAEEFARKVDGSDEGKRLVAQLVAKYDQLENKILPKSLVKNVRMTERHAGDKVVVSSYHRFDPIAIEKELFEVVGMFKSDQTLDENLERLRRDEGIELVPELIEYLYTAGVLVEPTTSSAQQAHGGEPRAQPSGHEGARRAALRAVLDARGLSPDAAANARIDAADASQLDHWIRKAAIAHTLSDALSS